MFFVSICVSSFFVVVFCCFFFFKQKTAYEMRISDWSSDVCSSDLVVVFGPRAAEHIVGQSGVVSENTSDVVAPILPGERRNACDRPVSTRTCHRADRKSVV